MADILISYDPELRDKAKMLADAIASNHWDVWWNARGDGHLYAHDFERAVNSARCVIHLHSTATSSSEQVWSERLRIADLKVPMLAVMVGGTLTPDEDRYLDTLPAFVDLRRWDSDRRDPEFVRMIDMIKWKAPTLTELRRSKIFLSYRRAESQDAAGRLYDTLVSAFGPGRVQMDVDTIPAGADFRKFITEAVVDAGVVVALIGRNWSRRSGSGGLHDPADFVRIELESALRHRVPIVPVLIHDQKMPDRDELPEEMESLLALHAIELRHSSWGSDSNRLIPELRRLITARQRELTRDPEPQPFGGAVFVCFGRERAHEANDIIDALCDEFGVEQIFNVSHVFTDEDVTRHAVGARSAVVVFLRGLFKLPSDPPDPWRTYPPPDHLRIWANLSCLEP